MVGEVTGFSVGQVTSWGDHRIMKGKILPRGEA